MKTAVLLLVLAWSGGAWALGVGDVAPDFRLKDLEGRERTLSELRQGASLLLDFGSVYCVSCQETRRGLERFRRKGKSRGIRVVAVNVDPPKAAKASRSVARGLRLEFPVLLDGKGATARAYGVAQIPRLFLIDDEGIVRAVYEELPRALERKVLQGLTPKIPPGR
ncbi:MAG: TlpA family protein disulfide reductase [Deltaproteobacteria bacterium]|nr:TlpA family protein disulfide reductase [Deltaproteobacteria bacterium]